jgi:predicted nucleotidyltransferase
MQRDEALALLREHKDEIMARYHVRHLALFGSMARNEARDFPW